MFETKHLALATSYPPPSSIHPTGCLLPRGPLIPTPADGGVCPVPECSRRAGPAVGPNQLLISCSEGLFVVLPPPQGPGQLRSGHGCPPPGKGVGEMGVLTLPEPPPSTKLPLLFKRKPSLGGSQGTRGQQRGSPGTPHSHGHQPRAHPVHSTAHLPGPQPQDRAPSGPQHGQGWGLPHQFSLLPSPWVKPWGFKGGDNLRREEGAKNIVGEGRKETSLLLPITPPMWSQVRSFSLMRAYRRGGDFS